MPGIFERCYRKGRTLPIAGAVLLAVGVILLFICIPCWAWMALIGVGLIAAGLVLMKQ